MLETLETLSSRLRMPPLIPAEVDKIRECISENKNATVELEKLQPSFEALKRRGEELIGRSQGADKDLAAKGISEEVLAGLVALPDFCYPNRGSVAVREALMSQGCILEGLLA